MEAYAIQPMVQSIACRQNNGTIKSIASKAITQDGLNPHCSIIDELHAHENRKLFDVLKSARGARKNPLSWYITTAGYNMLGVCYEQRTLVTRVLEGKDRIDHYFGIIYSLDVKEPGDSKSKSDDPFYEPNWIKANPNLGVSVDIEEFRSYAKEAKVSPLSQGEFKTKKLNLWVNAAAAWINMELWGECADPSLDIKDFYGEKCWIGGDLADKNDSVAIALIFRQDDSYVIFPYFYLPKDIVLQAADRTTPHYTVWAESGVLTLTDGDTTNYAKIQEDIERFADLFEVQSVIFDQFGSGQISANLNDNGIESIIMHKSAKTFTDPCKELEAKYQVGKIIHPDNPMLNWMAANVVVDMRVDGSLLPKKETRDSQNKIDGIDAIVNGISQAMFEETEGSLDDFLSNPIMYRASQ